METTETLMDNIVRSGLGVRLYYSYKNGTLTNTIGEQLSFYMKALNGPQASTNDSDRTEGVAREKRIDKKAVSTNRSLMESQGSKERGRLKLLG